jgi:hypothetical protein
MVGGVSLAMPAFYVRPYKYILGVRKSAVTVGQMIEMPWEGVGISLFLISSILSIDYVTWKKPLARAEQNLRKLKTTYM